MQHVRKSADSVAPLLFRVPHTVYVHGVRGEYHIIHEAKRTVGAYSTRSSWQCVNWCVALFPAQGTDAFSQAGLYSNHQDIGPRYAVSFSCPGLVVWTLDQRVFLFNKAHCFSQHVLRVKHDFHTFKCMLMYCASAMHNVEFKSSPLPDASR